jgi:hypothetical protein
MNDSYHLSLSVGPQSYDINLTRTDRPELVSLVVAGRGYAITGDETVGSLVKDRLSHLSSKNFENLESFSAVLLEGKGEVLKIQKIAIEHLNTGEVFPRKNLSDDLVIASESIPVESPKINLEPSLIKEINHVLSRDFDMSQTHISSIEQVLNDPTRRNQLLRIELKNNSDMKIIGSVIFKQSQHETESGKTPTEEEMKDSFARFSRDWAGLEFASSLQTENPICPKSYGGSKEHRFILVEDLGKNQESLDDHLLRGDALASEASLKRYMTCLGSFHAAGHKKINEYAQILHRINPEGPLNPDLKEKSIEGLVDEYTENMESVLTLIKLPHPKGLKDEIKTVLMTFDPKGPFATVTHSDPCPDNVFDFPDRLQLIDFEWTSVRSALLDVVYPRMNMPTGWCAGQFPEELLDSVEAIYREEIKKQMPAAGDDKVYFEAYAQACAKYILSDMRFLQSKDGKSIIFEEDKVWGIATERARILSHLKTFIKISEANNVLPILRSTAIEMLAFFEKNWPESKPLDLYAAFTKK